MRQVGLRRNVTQVAGRGEQPSPHAMLTGNRRARHRQGEEIEPGVPDDREVGIDDGRQQAIDSQQVARVQVPVHDVTGQGPQLPRVERVSEGLDPFHQGARAPVEAAQRRVHTVPLAADGESGDQRGWPVNRILRPGKPEPPLVKAQELVHEPVVQALAGRPGHELLHDEADVAYVQHSLGRHRPARLRLQPPCQDDGLAPEPAAAWIRVPLDHNATAFRPEELIRARFPAAQTADELITSTGRTAEQAASLLSAENDAVSHRVIFARKRPRLTTCWPGRAPWFDFDRALNMFMRSFAARQAGSPRTPLLMAPGWIRTDLGGPDAPYTIEEAIPDLVNVILSQQGTAGLRYLDRFGKTVPW